ncbi:hypothetical protein BH09MYX1_BH09MYX1_21790 [soil metagenome]
MVGARSEGSPFARALVPIAVAVAIAIQLFVNTRFYHCPVAYFVHQPCPTCGISRATWELLHLHFRQAFREHPLVYALDPYLGVLAITETYHWIRYGKLGAFLEHRAARVVGFAIASALFAIWIARFFGAFGGRVYVGAQKNAPLRGVARRLWSSQNGTIRLRS